MTTTSTDRITGTSTASGPGTDLAAIEALAGTGYAKRTATDIWALQTATDIKTEMSLVKGDVGLGNVDNTSDVNKPVSTAQAAANALALLKTGGTLTGALVVAAGTVSLAPLKFQSGTSLTSPTAGVWEFDGNVAYFTSVTAARQVMDAEQLVALTAAYTLTSQTAAQKIFNATANGAISVASNTTYAFECFVSLSSLSNSSGAFGFALAGGATLTRQQWWTNGNKATLATAAASQTTVNTSANTAIVTATTATVGWFVVRGIIRVGASGTLIPQVSLGIAAAAVVGTDSFFRIWALGADTVASVGNWS